MACRANARTFKWHASSSVPEKVVLMIIDAIGQRAFSGLHLVDYMR